MERTLGRRAPGGMPLQLVVGVGLALVIGLGLFLWTLNPPLEDLRAMTLFLSATAVLSVGVGYGLYRMGWVHRSPRLGWTLVGGYALASLLTFMNVYVTARLMFVNEHDLRLATVLLVYAGGIATTLGMFLSTAVTDTLRALEEAATAIAQGNHRVRVPVVGRNELARLAETFNQMAQRLEEAEDLRRQTEQMRRNLLVWLGHDLRTPLASLRAVTEALADGVVADPQQVERYLQIAQREVHALGKFIDDLFDMAQLDVGQLPMDLRANSLADLVSDSLESMAVLAGEKRIQLRGHVDPDVDPVTMDARLIGRVLANLLGNALRHTPPGGRVEVRAWRVDSGQVRVEVVDSGPGIPDAIRERIFEPFYRGEPSRVRSGGRVGLGLAIARGIVRAHGGEIGVESVPGQGSRFYFTLPS